MPVRDLIPGPVSAAKLLSQGGICVLVMIYQMIEDLGRWPSKLAGGRVQLIPKPGMAPTPDGLRPITIVSVWVRIWSRYRLLLLDPVILASLHPCLRGGIPGRDAVSQLGDLLASIEQNWNSRDLNEPNLFVLTIDASKCFDRIDRVGALDSGNRPFERPTCPTSPRSGHVLETT